MADSCLCEHGGMGTYGWGVTFQGSAPTPDAAAGVPVAMPASGGSLFNWFDCPTGETVLSPADCPRFLDTGGTGDISSWLNQNSGKVMLGAGLFFALVLFAKAGR